MNLADISKLGVANPFKQRYDNYIGGKFVAPVKGEYFPNITPITGLPFCEIARSTTEDVELALDAAHAAKEAWGKTSPAERANILNRIADRIEQNLSLIATAETIDNGKPIRETMNADIPLAIDHFRYFAGCIRAQEGSVAQIDAETYAYHYHEPLGVVGQIIPWNFPILMAVWKLAPALAAGNCVVLKPAEQTPASIMVLIELIGDLLPPGVLNIINGFGLEAGKPLASSKRIAKIAFTGETGTGRLIMGYAAQNLIPVTLELGGKSPNIFFEDVMDADDEYFAKKLEEWLVTARKKNVVVVMMTQFPSQIRGSKARSILEALPSQLLFPNGEAASADYDGFRLSDGEFDFVLSPIPGQRMVLSRTPRSSTVLNVDLKALGPLLTALGGGQAGLNAFGADYANRPKFWKE